MPVKKGILIVVTSHNRIDEKHSTGIWLEEFALPYQRFREAGFAVTVASPLGGAAPIDPRSLQGLGAMQCDETLGHLQQTAYLADIDPDGYAAVFLPGGHGTMFDLPHNKELQRLLGNFAGTERVIAALCHGPAGLVNIRRENGTPLVSGRTLTAFTNAEESAVGLDALMPFLLETRLRETGARFVAAPPWQDHVEVDGNLVTGQNPQSSLSAALAVLHLLK